MGAVAHRRPPAAAATSPTSKTADDLAAAATTLPTSTTADSLSTAAMSSLTATFSSCCWSSLPNPDGEVVPCLATASTLASGGREEGASAGEQRGRGSEEGAGPRRGET
jgi:cytoskeletal protein RodZ